MDGSFLRGARVLGHSASKAFARSGNEAFGYTFVNGGTANDNNTSETYSMNIGNADPGRVIAVGAIIGSGSVTLVSVVVNGVTLTPINFISDGSARSCGMNAGLVPTGSGNQNVVLTWSGSGFLTRVAYVWRLVGLTSNSAKNNTTWARTAGSGSGAITANSTDILLEVSAGNGSIPGLSGSETPNDRSFFAFNNFDAGVDWSIVGNFPASSFALTATGSNCVQAAASFR